MDSPFEYDAFISYRRKDGAAVANWLRHALQGFRAPRRLRELRQRRLVVYLDTAYERGTQDFFDHSILPALRASRFLIVLATPDAMTPRADAATDWMQREIEAFSSLPQHEHVIAVRAAGSFEGPLPGGLDQRYPQIELVDLRGAGQSTLFSPRRGARLQDELLKIAGPLLDVSQLQMPELRREQERRQQMRLGAWTGAGSALVVGAVTVAVLALLSERHAVRALQDASFATERAIQAADRALMPGEGPTDARGRLLDEVCDLRDRVLRESGAGTGAPRVRRVCKLERVRGLLAQADPAAARSRAEHLVVSLATDYQSTPDPSGAVELLRACDALNQPALAASGAAVPAPCRAEAAADRATTWRADGRYLAELSSRAVDRAADERTLGHQAVDRGESGAAAAAHWYEAARLYGEAAGNAQDATQRRRIEIDRAEVLIAAAAYGGGGHRTPAAEAALRQALELIDRKPDKAAIDPDLVKEADQLRDRAGQLRTLWQASR